MEGAQVLAFLPLGITLGAVCLAGACGAFMIYTRRLAREELSRAAESVARLHAKFQTEAALVAAEPGNLFVWTKPGDEPALRAGQGDALVQALEGEGGAELKEALAALGADGSMFSLTVPALDGRIYHTYGKTAAGQPALWMRDSTPAAEQIYLLSARLSEIEASRNAISDVLDFSSLPVWKRNASMDLVWANRSYIAAVEHTGLDAVIEAQAELDSASRELAERAAATGTSQRAKHYVVMNGSRRALEMTAVPLADGVATYAVDVSAIDDLARDLAQHKDAQDDTFNKLPVAVAVFGADQHLQFANQAFATLWGLDRAWLETRPSDGDIFEKLRGLGRLPEQRDFQLWKRERLSLYARVFDTQEDLWHIAGGKTLRVTASPHPLGGLIFIYADVTGQLELERSVNQLASVQRTSLDRLSDGVAVFGTDGRLKLHNSAFAKMWKLDPRILADQPGFAKVFSACRELLPDDAHWSWLTTLIASGAMERQGEYGPFERQDESVVTFATAPLPDGSLLITARDVTDSVAKAKMLEERNAALLAADKLKSEFIGHVSYQLRTPLTSIAGFAQLLKEGIAGPLTTQALAYLDNIDAASRTLETLINDILDLALIEAGRIELDVTEVDTQKVLDDVRLLVAARAEEAKIEIVYGVQPNLGPVRADAKRLSQIAYNLVINAIEHTPPLGKISVCVDAIGEDIRLYVSDTGIGIPPEYQPVAFDRFESATKSKTSRRAGLGLALVRSFVQLHGGWVSLDSQPGNGTTVICHLPRNAQSAQGSPADIRSEIDEMPDQGQRRAIPAE